MYYSQNIQNLVQIQVNNAITILSKQTIYTCPVTIRSISNAYRQTKHNDHQSIQHNGYFPGAQNTNTIETHFLRSDSVGMAIGQGFPRIRGSYPNLGGEKGHEEGCRADEPKPSQGRAVNGILYALPHKTTWCFKYLKHNILLKLIMPFFFPANLQSSLTSLSSSLLTASNHLTTLPHPSRHHNRTSASRRPPLPHITHQPGFAQYMWTS